MWQDMIANHKDCESESEAFDLLCSHMGELCDGWQDGKLTGSQFVRAAKLAAEAWLFDQERHGASEH